MMELHEFGNWLWCNWLLAWAMVQLVAGHWLQCNWLLGIGCNWLSNLPAFGCWHAAPSFGLAFHL